MSVSTKRIFHINAAATTLNNTQMCIEDTNDSDLGFQMWCGKDDAGVVTKWLAKDQNAKVTQLTATSRVYVVGGADITGSATLFNPDGDFIVESATGEVNLETGTGQDMNLVVKKNCIIDASQYVTITGGSNAKVQVYPSANGDFRITDGQMESFWTKKYVEHSADSSETAQYKTDFGEVSLFEALHQCKAGGSVSRPDTEIIWGTGSSYNSEGNFTYNDAYNQVRVINNHNETNWYDTNAASLLLQGTATQGNSIVANGDLNIGTLHSTVSNVLSLVARNTGGSGYYPKVHISAIPTAANSAGSVEIEAHAEGTNVEGWIRMLAEGVDGETSNGGGIELKVDNDSSEYSIQMHDGILLFDTPANWNYVDFNGVELRNVGPVDFGLSNSITVTANDFDFDPDDGVSQRVSISANTTWDISSFSPNNCSRSTMWITNTDSSAHTLTLNSSTNIKFFGSYGDGFSIPANSEAVVTIIRDTSNFWGVAVSLEAV